MVDAVAMMDDAQKKKTSILIEGANALMLDIDYGAYWRSAFLPTRECFEMGYFETFSFKASSIA